MLNTLCPMFYVPCSMLHDLCSMFSSFVFFCSMFYALCLMLHITCMFTFSVTMSSICHPSPICMLFLIVYYFASSSMFNESLPLFKPSCFIGYYASSSMLHVPYSCTFFYVQCILTAAETSIFYTVLYEYSTMLLPP